jgi:cold shock CspA family protein
MEQEFNMDKSKFGSGIIKKLDVKNNMGIIVQEGGGPDVFFKFEDHAGKPAEGQLVQFVKDTTKPDATLAKNIVVLSDAPRYKKAF